MITRPLHTVWAFAAFAYLLVCEVITELRGRAACGDEWEPGDGLGREDDYQEVRS